MTFFLIKNIPVGFQELPDSVLAAKHEGQPWLESAAGKTSNRSRPGVVLSPLTDRK